MTIFFVKTHKWYFVTGIAIIAFPIILNYSMFTWRAIGVNGDWSGFLGNYSGGIIGGIVALLVTKFQITQQKKMDVKNRLLKQLPTLHAIKIEIEKLKKVMEGYSSGFNKFEDLQSEIVRGKHIPANWNKELFSNLDLIVDQRLLVEILHFREEYDRIWTYLHDDLEDLRMELEENVKKRAKALFDKRIIQRRAELIVLIAQIEDGKKYAWDSISKGVIVTRIDSIIDKLDEEIGKVDKLAP